MGNATRVATVAVGDVYLQFSQDRILVIKDCLYVPSIRRNLIYVSRLVENKYFIHFNDKSVIIRKNRQFICSGTLVNDLYIINPDLSTLQLNELNSTNSLPIKRKEPSKMNQTYHCTYALVILI